MKKSPTKKTTAKTLKTTELANVIGGRLPIISKPKGAREMD